jgi:hypothetical protein
MDRESKGTSPRMRTETLDEIYEILYGKNGTHIFDKPFTPSETKALYLCLTKVIISAGFIFHKLAISGVYPARIHGAYWNMCWSKSLAAS